MDAKVLDWEIMVTILDKLLSKQAKKRVHDSIHDINQDGPTKRKLIKRLKRLFYEKRKMVMKTRKLTIPSQ